jgi:uncharacterized membrane protein (UPF0182 family)
MRDLFDDFMDELRRRQAEAGERPSGRRPDEPPEDPDRPPSEDEAAPDARAADEDARDEDLDEPLREPEEVPFRERTSRVSSRRRRRRARGAGGDGRGDGPGPIGQAMRRLGCVGLVLVLGLVLGLAAFGIDLWTDAIWFRTVGFESVFWTRIGTELILFVATAVIALIVFLGNLAIASRLAPPPDEGRPGPLRNLVERLNEAARTGERGGPFDPFGSSYERRPPFGARPVVVGGDELPDLAPVANWVIAGISVLVALGLAAGVAGSWETILLWQQRIEFGQADPIFGRDVSFFLFELPFLRLGQAVFNALVFGALLVIAARYIVGALRGGPILSTPVRVHLGILGGLYLLSVAAGYQLDKFELGYSTQSGTFTGVSYTDQAAKFLALDVLSGIAALAAALLVGGAFTRFVWPLGAAVIVWFGASIVLGQAYPAAIQQFVVRPNQFAQEQPYIENNIRMTRLAYGLDQFPQEQPYTGEALLTAEQVEAEAPTFQNARLWDYRPLGATLDQVQVVRQYYDFFDVDADRYPIGGETRQVWLSARELKLTDNPATTNWVNQRIVFTHGIGVSMVPVNEVGSQGLPRLLIRDLPPRSEEGAPEISEGRIYFGEAPSDYVIVGAKQSEFDFPQATSGGAEQAIETRWAGSTGIRLDTVLARLLFATRFRDLNLLISDQVTAESQLLFHRSLGDRLNRIAPFLRYDKDPYVVVNGAGRLVYIQDAYTTSDRFPNADPFFPAELEDTGLGAAPFNYIRNSVKIVMDAYDGTMTFYVADPGDPIVRAYQGVFPALFRPMDQMPADLRPHLRVPEELFNVQTRTYGRYHVQQARAFFENSDLWTVPEGQTNERSLPTEAYYVYMRIPGESEPEFLLLQPMVPRGRPNMIAWIAARNDGEHLGERRIFRFPTETNVFGPAQIEAQIDADPIISAQISLWDQSGSEVQRGNLIVVPVEDSIVYLQPIYLRSTSSAFPRFERIVVASPRHIVWSDNLDEALELLLQAEAGGRPTPTPTPTPTPEPGVSPSPGASPAPTGPPASPPPGDVGALIDYANQHFELAQQALRDGDFARYGDEIRLVEDALRQLRLLVPPSAVPSLTPSPVPSPGP